jgi:hypothetical protein
VGASMRDLDRREGGSEQDSGEGSRDSRPPRVRLYEPAVHFFIIGVTMIWSLVAIPAVTISWLREGQYTAALISLPVLLAFVAAFYKTMWRAKRVHLDDDRLLVGHWTEWKVIPIASIVRVERPGWVRRDVFAPTEVFVRDAKPVMFFPIAGAEELLRIRSNTTHVPPSTL